MVNLEKSIIINAPKEKVFERLTQCDKTNEWLSFVEKTEYTTIRKTGVTTKVKNHGKLFGTRQEWDGYAFQWEKDKRIGWR